MPRTNEALKNNEEKMKLARGLYQMLSGTTFTYYGEEIGMAGPKKKDDPINDSNYRAGMFWSATDTKEQPVSQWGYATTDDTIVTLENDIVTMAKNAIVVLK